MTLRRYVVRRASGFAVLAVLGVVAAWRRAAGQAGAWSVAPAAPTVGDTIWLERWIAAPAGWRLRPGRLEPGGGVEPLGEPLVVRAGDGWVVRYPVVAWRPGAHQLSLPPLWRLGPDGRADSLAGGSIALELRSVIPDTLERPQPRPAVGLLRGAPRNPVPLAVALVASAGLLAAGIRWRRRPPRDVPGAPPAAAGPAVADARWLAAGEPKAVAARAAGALRSALARAVPAAHEALGTEECLSVVARERPGAPVRELAEVLGALEQVGFAAAHGTDVATLAARARRLAQGLGA